LEELSTADSWGCHVFAMGCPIRRQRAHQHPGRVLCRNARQATHLCNSQR
jgi:hypothetical protein